MPNYAKDIEAQIDGLLSLDVPKQRPGAVHSFNKLTLPYQSNGQPVHCIEIHTGLDPTNTSIEAATIAPQPYEIGILLVGVDHGEEPQNGPSLVKAAQRLLAALLTIRSTSINLGMLPQTGAPFDVLHPTDIKALNAYYASKGFPTALKSPTIELSEIQAWFANLHIFMIPVVNRYGYDNHERLNAHAVNINRNYPVLWKGQRQGAANYYFNGKLPTTVSVTLGEAGATDYDITKAANETKNVIAAMRRRITAFVDFHTGYGWIIQYPWSFQQTGVVGLNSWGDGADHPQMRYCNPGFGATGWTWPAEPGKTPSYHEYMPQATYDNHLRALAGMQQYLTPASSLHPYWTGFGSQTVTGNSKLFTPSGAYTDLWQNSATPSDDPGGGESCDYFLSLDLCNAVAFNVECGGNSATQLEVDCDLTLMVFGLLRQMASWPTVGRLSSTSDADCDWTQDWQRAQRGCP